MNLQEYSAYDAVGLAELVRKKQVSASELNKLAYDAGNKINPKLNAIVEFYDDRIEESKLESSKDSFFQGVPFLVKDLALMDFGKKVEAGSRLSEGMIAPFDSELMSRYKRAGLNNIGRTTCPEFGFSCATESVLRGITNNPWDVEKSTGGSSGGAAAAVASGIVPVAHASDAGGSIRCPASCCGLFGLKPSRGRISLSPAGDGFNGLANEHVISRSVRDSAAILDFTQGYLAGDPYSATPPTNLYIDECSKDPQSLTIGFTKEPNELYSIDDEVKLCVDDAAKLCEHLGHVVVEDSPSWDEPSAIRCNLDLWAANCVATTNMLSSVNSRDVNEETIEKITLASYEYGSGLLSSVFVDALGTANQISRQVVPFFERYDILLTPTLLRSGIEHGQYSMQEYSGSVQGWFEKMGEIGNFLSIFNITGLPAMSVPLFVSKSGLPIGIQFVAGYGREDLLFQLAGQLERESSWVHRKPKNHISY